MIKKITLMFIMVITLSVVGCSDSSKKTLTKLDIEFNEYAMDVAEELLNQEIKDRATIKVETGTLQYKYTIYNETLDVYKVKYVAKYDTNKNSKHNEEWIEIKILLDGNTKLVLNYDSLWHGGKYEEFGCDVRTDSDGFWYNINLTEKEIEKYKKEYGL